MVWGLFKRRALFFCFGLLSAASVQLVAVDTPLYGDYAYELAIEPSLRIDRACAAVIVIKQLLESSWYLNGALNENQAVCRSEGQERLYQRELAYGFVIFADQIQDVFICFTQVFMALLSEDNEFAINTWVDCRRFLGVLLEIKVPENVPFPLDILVKQYFMKLYPCMWSLLINKFVGNQHDRALNGKASIDALNNRFSDLSWINDSSIQKLLPYLIDIYIKCDSSELVGEPLKEFLVRLAAATLNQNLRDKIGELVITIDS